MTDYRTHKLKCWESVFLQVRARRKRAEFRRNDRDFAVGDLVVLLRWRPGARDGMGSYVEANGEITFPSGDIDEIRVVISHITTGFGIPDGYCMFSFLYADELETK